MSVRCFFLEPTGRYVRELRRYSERQRYDVDRQPEPNACKLAYHDAKVVLDIQDGGTGDENELPASGDVFPHTDPRWPTHCSGCGYEFTGSDEYLLNHTAEYRRTDTGELTTIRDAPVGAMWLAPWLAGHGSITYQGQRSGQPHLIVKTPRGDWDVDGPSTNGNGWSWTGNPRHPVTVTARPSIQIHSFHAFLTNGELVDC
jgi:hypothetical protein